MMAAAMPAHVGKEVRAVLPASLACAAAIGIGALTDDRALLGAAQIAFGLGAIALGAHAFGHEYTYRTLPILLAQPTDRRRLFLLKIAVVAAILIVLTVAAAPVLFPGSQAGTWRRPIVLMPALCGLFFAPCLTLLCRNPIAGVVFSIAVVGMTFTIGDIAGGLRYGAGSAEGDSFSRAFVTWGLASAGVVAAVLSWRTFQRLEAIDGSPGVHVQLPWRGLTASRSRPRHRITLLVSKELRLQSVVFMLAGLYLVAAAAALIATRRSGRGVPEFVWGPATSLYIAMFSIMVGSLASAEERHYGTLEWQTLLPMASWKQWGVKAGTAGVLVFVLAVLMPLLLGPFVLKDEVWDGGHFGRQLTHIVPVLVLTSLYVSTVTTSGMRALVISLFACVAAVIALQLVGTAIWWLSIVLANYPRSREEGMQLVATFRRVEPLASAASVAGYALLALWFGFVNHRTAERGPGRLWRQVAVYGGFFAVVVLAGAILVTILRVR
jgi:hypothetical protein